MADPQSEAKIRDLERRMAAMPGSRIFVGLAEEYRRAGRFGDALATLRTGLEAHPGYLSARIAIARLYQEMGRDDEAIEAFARVLAADRENLVAAKALGDLYARRGNALEAVKKYKLYRALSGEKSIDEKIAALERETKPEAPPPPAISPAASPAPSPSATEARMFDPINYSDSSAEFRFDPNATLALSTLEFSPASVEPPGPGTTPEEAAAPVAAAGESPAAEPPPAAPEEPATPEGPPLSEITLPDLILPAAAAETPYFEETAEIPAEAADAVLEEPAAAGEPAPAEAGEAPLSEAIAEAAPQTFGSDAAMRETAPAEEEPVMAPAPELPASRTLAELYERQGFRDEASRIYERLAAEHPGDESLVRRIAALRSPESSPAAPEDPRARKRRILEAWLARVKANAAAGAPPS